MGIIRMGVPEDIVGELQSLSGSDTFVETGTYMGGTARWAASRFRTVHTVERAPEIHRLYAAKLANESPNVTAHLGDSRAVLPEIIGTLGHRPVVYWLDGHWSGGQTAGADDECPILDELGTLRSRQNDFVLIDDARLFLCAPPLPHDAAQWPTMKEICEAAERWDSPRFIQVIDDVIFIVPDQPAVRSAVIGYARRISAAQQLPAPSTKVRSRIARGLRRVASKFER